MTAHTFGQDPVTRAFIQPDASIRSGTIVLRLDARDDVPTVVEKQPLSEDNRDLPEGTTVGRYIVVSRLAFGGMGVVYVAVDPELDRRVVVKLVRAHGSAALQARLLREARALAQVSHPNVVTVYDVGTYRDGVFVAMEYIEGTTLGDWLRRERPPWRVVLGVLIGAGRGLAAVHDHGLVHRDFKPGNVVVDRAGQPHVLDFGLVLSDSAAWHRAESSASDRHQDRPATDPVRPLTVHGSVLGTPGYMSPEQIDCEPIDARSDQYSFCVVAYEALFGVRPFSGKSLDALTDAMKAQKVAPPRVHEAPARLADLLERGLAWDPADRHRNLHVVLRRLEFVRSRRWGWWAALAGAALLAGGIGFASGSNQPAVASDPDPCHGLHSTAAIWNGEQSERVAASFGAVELPYAADFSTQVIRELDAYQERWEAARAVICHDESATTPRAQKDRQRQIGCLNRRYSALETLVARLVSADEGIVKRSVGAVLGLPVLDVCQDIEGLRMTIPSPEDPAMRKRVDQERKNLALARSFFNTGKYTQALKLAKTLRTAAVELEYPPLEAEALVMVSIAYGESGDPEKARANALETVAKAYAAGDDRTVVGAISLLVFYLQQAGKLEEANRWISVGEGALARGGKSIPASVRTSFLSNSGAVATAGGEWHTAERLFLESMALDRLSGALDSRIASSLTSLATVYRRQGRLEEALEVQEEALALRSEAFGPSHPVIGRAYLALASIQMDLGDWPGMEASTLRSYELWQALEPSDHTIARILFNLREIDLNRGQLHAALDKSDEIEKLSRKVLGEGAREVRYAGLRRGAVRERMGQFDAALAEVKSFLERSRRHAPDDIAEQVDGRALRARVWGRMGRLRDARVEAAAVLALASSELGENRITMAELEELAAELALWEGDFEAARDFVDRAFEDRRAATGDREPHVATLILKAQVESEGGNPETARSLIAEIRARLDPERTSPATLAQLTVAEARIVGDARGRRRLAKAALNHLAKSEGSDPRTRAMAQDLVR